jgi:aminocarboxymuconate-semialdehyde decarboxylase
MAKPPVIDIHAHWFPQSYLELFAKHGARCGATFINDPRGPILEVGAMRTAPLDRRFIDLDTRLKAMDRQGVDVHALSLTSPMVFWADGELSAQLCRAFNDACNAAHAGHPDRFVGLAMLPMLDPPRALAELERVAKLPGIRGIYCSTTVWDRELGDPLFWPIYERIETLDLPIFLHPVKVIGLERLKPYYLSNFLGNPFDTAVGASHLIMSGVLDKFPRLKVNLPHAGGALPYLIGRLDHGAGVRPECKHLTQPPSHYLARFTYDTISHSYKAMDYLIGLVGAERILLGSDYCFDMGYDEPARFVRGIQGLSEAQRDAILGATAAELLKLA